MIRGGDRYVEMADETGGKKTKTKKTRNEKKRRRDRGERSRFVFEVL